MPRDSSPPPADFIRRRSASGFSQSAAEGHSFRVRRASESELPFIKDMVRAARINPTGLDWQRFRVAVAEGEGIIGCGQVKPHRDGTQELASIVVVRNWRGRGVARLLIERLMLDAGAPLWLTCRSGLVGLYQRFGFREVGPEEDQPAYFRRMRRLAGVFEMLAKRGEYLAVMTWDGTHPGPS